MITDQELLLLEELVHYEEIYQRREALKSAEGQNPNYKHLLEVVPDEFLAGTALEGSSRSGKTIESINQIIHLCLHVEESAVFNLYRETYASFKDTLYDDFKKRLDFYDLPNPFHDAKEVKSFKIGRNKITFLGCDKISMAHGAGCDYAYFNEIMHIPQNIFDQVEMRCRKFWWADYNPSFSEHWFFNSVLKRSDVGFIRTTFLDNKFISKQEKNKILSYEPWEPGTYEVIDNVIMYEGLPVTEINQPPPHIDNIDQGTADEFMWKVYGLGLRGSMKGQIYKLVTWIPEFPPIAHTFGLDFGFVKDETALVRYAREGMNVYFELLIYQPIDNPEELDSALEAVGVSKYVPITADSSDKYVSETKGAVQMVNDLYERGWEISKVSKTQSIMYWIQDMKRYKIHIVKNNLYKHFKKEQENYVFKEVNGIMINQPIDGWDHAFTSARYSHMSHDLDNFSVDSN